MQTLHFQKMLARRPTWTDWTKRYGQCSLDSLPSCLVDTELVSRQSESTLLQSYSSTRYAQLCVIIVSVKCLSGRKAIIGALAQKELARNYHWQVEASQYLTDSSFIVQLVHCNSLQVKGRMPAFDCVCRTACDLIWQT